MLDHNITKWYGGLLTTINKRNLEDGESSRGGDNPSTPPFPRPLSESDSTNSPSTPFDMETHSETHSESVENPSQNADIFNCLLPPTTERNNNTTSIDFMDPQPRHDIRMTEYMDDMLLLPLLPRLRMPPYDSETPRSSTNSSTPTSEDNEDHFLLIDGVNGFFSYKLPLSSTTAELVFHKQPVQQPTSTHDLDTSSTISPAQPPVGGNPVGIQRFYKFKHKLSTLP